MLKIAYMCQKVPCGISLYFLKSEQRKADRHRNGCKVVFQRFIGHKQMSSWSHRHPFRQIKLWESFPPLFFSDWMYVKRSFITYVDETIYSYIMLNIKCFLKVKVIHNLLCLMRSSRIPQLKTPIMLALAIIIYNDMIVQQLNVYSVELFFEDIANFFKFWLALFYFSVVHHHFHAIFFL